MSVTPPLPFLFSNGDMEKGLLILVSVPRAVKPGGLNSEA